MGDRSCQKTMEIVFGKETYIKQNTSNIGIPNTTRAHSRLKMGKPNLNKKQKLFSQQSMAYTVQIGASYSKHR